jgi:hypothetical protein
MKRADHAYSCLHLLAVDSIHIHMLHDVLQPCSIAAMPVYMVTVCIAMACGASTWYVILIYMLHIVTSAWMLVGSILFCCNARRAEWYIHLVDAVCNATMCGAYGACGVSVCNWILLYHRWCFVCIGKSWQLTTTVATRTPWPVSINHLPRSCSHCSSTYISMLWIWTVCTCPLKQM